VSKSVHSAAGGGGRSPLEVARMALALSGGLGAEVEAYVERGRTVSIKTFGGEVESVTVAEPSGLGVRAIRQGRTGYAFTSDLSEEGVRRALHRAADNLKAADPDEFSLLPGREHDGYPVLPDLWRPGISSTSLDRKTALALAAESAALAVGEVETVEESVYSDEEAHVAIASSAGVEAESAQSFCFVYVQAHAGRDRERQSGLGFSAAREPDGLDAEAAGRDAGEKARALLGARPCPTGLYTVVFDREVVAALLGSVARALSADAVQKGRSVFAAKLGQSVASPLLHLTDDGLAREGMATRPFDGEGVAQRETVLIDDGALRSFLHSSYTARKAGSGLWSTGNAVRGSYRTLPGVGATNLVVRPGEGTLEALLSRVGQGLYVDSLAGLHSGVNAISGEISVGATGRMISAGTLGAPVREVTVATDFISLLKGVRDLGGDARWTPMYGSVYAPSLAVAGITVSGA
jgi:PmbA protein